MNLQTPMGSVGNAGAVAFGVPQAAPAHFQVGAVGFGPQWTMEDSMAASIVRLEQENEELRAEVALLREEQKILAKGFPSPAKAAVIEGVEQQNLPAGVSRIGCHERPEPSPHFSDTPETDEAVERWRQGKINIFDEMARLERERDEAERENEQLLASNKTYERDWPVLVHERDEAWAQLQDIKDAMHGANNPHPDEVHCACVPLLRVALAQARGERDELRAVLEVRP